MALIEVGSNIDLSHPSIGAVAVTSQQANYLNCNMLLTHLKSKGVPEELLPVRPTSGSTFLQRAMVDAIHISGLNKTTKEDDKPAYRVVTKGKAKNIQVHLVAIQTDMLDLEVGEGKGVADSVLSAKIQMNPVTKEDYIVFYPNDHELCETIEKQYDFHRDHFKCSDDLSRWVSQTLMNHKLIGAVSKPGHGGGMYFVPKGDGFDLLVKIQEALDEVSSTSNRKLHQGVKIYLMPMLTTFPDVVDVLTDALIQDFEKSTEAIDAYIMSAEEKETSLRDKSLDRKFQECEDMAKKLSIFTDTCGVSVSDLEPRIKALKARLGVLQFQNS